MNSRLIDDDEGEIEGEFHGGVRVLANLYEATAEDAVDN